MERLESKADDAEPRLPHPRDVWAALGLLTALPCVALDIRSARAAPATLFFPIVGGLMGLLLMGGNWILGARLPPVLSAVVLVAVWEAVSGGVALQACGGRNRDSSWSRFQIGAARSAKVLCAVMAAVLLLKVVLLTRYVASRSAALLFAPMLARWAMVVLAVGARDAAAPSSKLNTAITFREFALTSVLTCAIVFTVAQAFGILLVVGVAALTLVLRLLQHRQPGGTSWPLLLASAELVELLVVVIGAAVLSA